MGGRELRGRHPGAVAQETWALLARYQVLRTVMADAALAHSGIDPHGLSFGIALRAARDQVVHGYGIMPGIVVDLVWRIGAAVQAAPMPTKRIRTRVRVVERAISKYRPKERNIDGRTDPATLSTKILMPPLDPKPAGIAAYGGRELRA